MGGRLHSLGTGRLFLAGLAGAVLTAAALGSTGVAAAVLWPAALLILAIVMEVSRKPATNRGRLRWVPFSVSVICALALLGGMMGGDNKGQVAATPVSSDAQETWLLTKTRDGKPINDIEIRFGADGNPRSILENLGSGSPFKEQPALSLKREGTEDHPVITAVFPLHGVDGDLPRLLALTMWPELESSARPALKAWTEVTYDLTRNDFLLSGTGTRRTVLEATDGRRKSSQDPAFEIGGQITTGPGSFHAPSGK